MYIDFSYLTNTKVVFVVVLHVGEDTLERNQKKKKFDFNIQKALNYIKNL